LWGSERRIRERRAGKSRHSQPISAEFGGKLIRIAQQRVCV
jgi:hypothetical protein